MDLDDFGIRAVLLRSTIIIAEVERFDCGGALLRINVIPVWVKGLFTE